MTGIQYLSKRGWQSYKAVWPTVEIAKEWARKASEAGTAHRVIDDGGIYIYYKDGKDVTRQ